MWRNGLWHKMRQYGVEEKFVRACKGLYSGVETRVVLNGGLQWKGGLGKDTPCCHSYLIST